MLPKPRFKKKSRTWHGDNTGIKVLVVWNSHLLEVKFIAMPTSMWGENHPYPIIWERWKVSTSCHLREVKIIQILSYSWGDNHPNLVKEKIIHIISSLCGENHSHPLIWWEDVNDFNLPLDERMWMNFTSQRWEDWDDFHLPKMWMFSSSQRWDNVDYFHLTKMRGCRLF